MGVAMMNITRAGRMVGTIRAEHVATLDRAKYELALMTGVHGPSVLRGIASLYNDGCMSVHPVNTKGHRLGRPYMFEPYTLGAWCATRITGRFHD